jgi:hypothetical protein
MPFLACHTPKRTIPLPVHARCVQPDLEAARLQAVSTQKPVAWKLPGAQPTYWQRPAYAALISPDGKARRIQLWDPTTRTWRWHSLPETEPTSLAAA